LGRSTDQVFKWGSANGRHGEIVHADTGFGLVEEEERKRERSREKRETRIGSMTEERGKSAMRSIYDSIPTDRRVYVREVNTSNRKERGFRLNVRR